MVTELFTNRAFLTPFAQSDAEELLALFRDPSVRRYLLDDVVVPEQWMREEIQSSSERFKRTGAGLWSVRLIGEKKILGFAGFREFFDPPQLQLLYGLLPAYWGKGLARELAARMCDEAFITLGFREVVAATDQDNKASSRLLERLGMEPVQASGAGTPDTLFYQLDRVRWERLRLSHPAHWPDR